MSATEIEDLFSNPLERPPTVGETSQFRFKKVVPYAGSNTSFEQSHRHSQTQTVQVALAGPDISFAKPFLIETKPSERESFSLFNESHAGLAEQLFRILTEAPDRQAFIVLGDYMKKRLDAEFFQYVLAVALEHRKDITNVKVKRVSELFPGSFVQQSAFSSARRASHFATHVEIPVVRIPFHYTASNDDKEHQVAYFREDIGVNSHHWHWHLVYPTWGPSLKDRRGELFYYMHRQILARYDVERACNGLDFVKPILNLREPIEEGYFPKILNNVNNRTFPPRWEGVQLKDLERKEGRVKISAMEDWITKITAAIESGFLISARGERIHLNTNNGIDILGNTIEPSQLSVNRGLYGAIHNSGHQLISYCHDPKGKYLEPTNVMGDIKTSMRDPVFYRWHKAVDLLFEKHKRKLRPYSAEELGYNGIMVDNIELSWRDGRNIPIIDVLETFWDKSAVDIGYGIDFNKTKNVLIEYTHIQHRPFTYIISVTNSRRTLTRGTCRIFMCPKKSGRGEDLNFDQKRLLTIEMDKFIVDLKPGFNIIRRGSIESNVTIPHERTFRNMNEISSDSGKLEDNSINSQFCGCGWPHHLLVPKGNPQGMDFDLFAMISNYDDDSVPNAHGGPECSDSISYCGLRDAKYPDRRPMGFPFDRSARVETIEQFTIDYPNMVLKNIKIYGKPQPQE